MDSDHALDVSRTIDASPSAVFDAFVALYDSERPSWVLSSSLDLRVGGRWSVAFQVPDGPAFREERVLTVVDRPECLAYDMTAVYDEQPAFETSVRVTVTAVPGGQELRLVQRGFPTDSVRDQFAAAWPDVLAEIARRLSA